MSTASLSPRRPPRPGSPRSLPGCPPTVGRCRAIQRAADPPRPLSAPVASPAPTASLIVAIATLAWTIYNDQRTRTPDPPPSSIARQVRITLRDQDTILPRAHHQSGRHRDHPPGQWTAPVAGPGPPGAPARDSWRDRRSPRRSRAVARSVSHSRLSGAVRRWSPARLRGVRGRRRAAGKCRSADSGKRVCEPQKISGSYSTCPIVAC